MDQGNLEMSLGERTRVLLIRCHQKLNAAGRDSQTQGRILKLLYLGGPMTQRTLQDKLEIRPGSMSELAAKLERKGLLRRERSPEDKRKVLLTLTEAGRADVERFRAAGRRPHGRGFDALTGEEQETLCALLQRLLDSWEEDGCR